MNAYELADELKGVASIAKPTDDGVTYGLAGYCIKAATMLRQQADRIAELEKATGFAGYCNGMMVFEDKSPQIKELSDEEIDEIASMCSVNESGQINTREFARAILKKASEK